MCRNHHDLLGTAVIESLPLRHFVSFLIAWGPLRGGWRFLGRALEDEAQRGSALLPVARDLRVIFVQGAVIRT